MMVMSPPPIHAAPATASSGLATASMICGILALPTCFVTVLPAIIMGHIAWSQASKEGRGPGHAKLGLIFGYGSLLLIPLIAVIAGLTAPMLIRQRDKVDQAASISHVRQIGLALNEYQADHGTYPPDLEKLESELIIEDVDSLLRIRNPKPGENWLYNPKADRSSPGAPLLISPPVAGSRTVLRVDGAVVRAPEKELSPIDEAPWISIPPPAKSTR
jgi:type II secretory pathway pseudopilin PulG